MTVFLQAGTLLAHHAESMSRWRFHYPPGADLLNTTCAQGFQSLHFGFDVGRFNVQVHAARVVNRLQEDAWLPFVRDQLPVVRIRRILKMPAIAPERRRPKVRGGIEVTDLAIDDDLRKPAAMHVEVSRI
jgi:hypothetical protein